MPLNIAAHNITALLLANQ